MLLRAGAIILIATCLQACACNAGLRGAAGGLFIYAIGGDPVTAAVDAVGTTAIEAGTCHETRSKN